MRPEKILDYLRYEDDRRTSGRFEVLSVEEAEIELFRIVRMGGTALKASWMDDISYAAVNWLGESSLFRVIDFRALDNRVLVTRGMELSAAARFQFPKLNIIKNPIEVQKRDIAFFESEAGAQEIMLVSEVTTSNPRKRKRKRILPLAKPAVWPNLQPGFSSFSETP